MKPFPSVLLPLLVASLAVSPAGCMPASDLVAFRSPEMGFEATYPAAWAQASDASPPTSYGICAGAPHRRVRADRQ